MTTLAYRLAEVRGVNVRTFDPPVGIAAKASSALRSSPKGVTSWLNKACEGHRKPVIVHGRDTHGKSIPQLISMWMNGDDAQILAASHALRDRYDLDFSAEHRDEGDRQLRLAGIAAQETT